MTLPDAEWRHRPGLDALIAALGDARFVGGSVRDTLLGIAVSDIDLATASPPEHVIDLLAAARIKAVPTGFAHGTITAVIESGPVEVTTLRRDVSTDGRHAVVAFTDDWREDAARRDFTMNALYADPATGEVFDYFGGLADLADRRVRFIGDPFDRIAEDHLRILRFFRFLARFGDAPDPAGLEACTARAKDLMALSRERIRDELLKLLVAKNAVGVVRLMVERGIFAPVLPEVTFDGIERLDALAAFEKSSGIGADSIRRLAALLPPQAQLADSVGARLKLSNVQRANLASAVEPASGKPLALGYRIGPERAIDRIALSPAWEEAEDRAAAVRQLRDWAVPRLPISGGALIQRGLSKGPDVARTLRRIEDRWVEEGFPNADRVNAIADECVAQALSPSSSA